MNTLCSPWLIFRVFFIPSRFILAAGSRVGNSLFRSSLFRAKSLILKRESLSLFFKKSDCEQIAPIALYKKKNCERWERFALFHERIALSLTKNERFARKTEERIPNPAGESSFLLNWNFPGRCENRPEVIMYPISTRPYIKGHFLISDFAAQPHF